MKILITGIHGFLGSALSRYLCRTKKQFSVYGLTRKKSSLQSSGIIECDLNQTSQLQKILFKLKPDIIFHCAGGRYSDEQKTFEANFTATKNLLETVKELKLACSPRIVIPGSAGEYGNIKSKRLITEDCLPRPLQWYGFVKLLQTHLTLFYKNYGLDVVAVRIFNISGTNTPTGLAIGQFAQHIVAIERGEEPIIRTKNLSGRRDVCDIEDICKGLWMIAQKGKSGEIYNLCSARSITFRQLLQQMLKYAKVKSIRIEENKQDTSSSFDVVGSNTKLKSLIAWSPQVDLVRSLKNTLESYRNH